MELGEFKQHLDNRLDKLETKLDNHMERLAAAETSINWLKGYVKINVSILIAALSGLASALYHYLTKS